MNRTRIIFCFFSMLIASQSQAKEAIIYNLDEYGWFLNFISISGGELIFNEKFIDGDYEEGEYKNGKVFIANCRDFSKYDLREITNIPYTARHLLLQRKRACLMLDKIKKADRITIVKKTNVNYVKNLSKKQQKWILELFKFPLNSKLQCSSEYPDFCYFFEDKDKERLHFSKVLEQGDKSYFFAETIVNDYGRTRSFFIVTLGEKGATKHWILK